MPRPALARAAGVNDSTVRDIERGREYPYATRKIRAALAYFEKFGPPPRLRPPPWPKITGPDTADFSGHNRDPGDGGTRPLPLPPPSLIPTAFS